MTAPFTTIRIGVLRNIHAVKLHLRLAHSADREPASAVRTRLDGNGLTFAMNFAGEMTKSRALTQVADDETLENVIRGLALPSVHCCCCCSCSTLTAARAGMGRDRTTKLGVIGSGAMSSAGLTVTATLNSLCDSPLYTPRVGGTSA